ncbi:transposase [Candidatus Tisiphia endosymbiont of Ditula angustiorana]|uniref:transposase n=1 Tax=Candidatus Tisiphia endosymbiont of Ditula angustiorana TaxID=3066272 RepID=UPI00312CBD46
MDQRLYPIKADFFRKEIEPIIEKNYIWKGRPVQISHYRVFCAIMYVLRTGVPWRDLPKCYGCWHTIYQRFKRGSERGIWWKILMLLQCSKKIMINIVISDSSIFKLHRHGGGLKGGVKPRGRAREE